ncbi:MAG: T9SS type A sorting domain-containing protein [Crocinitomicaceae bacterium]
MRKIYLLSFAFFAGLISFGQSTCTDPISFLVPDVTPQTISSTGGYYEFNATMGCDYSFSHCQNGGSYTGDTYLTITDDLNNTLSSNDDWCGLGSELTWTSTVNGIVRIHLGECCGGTGVCGGGPTRVLAYWSSCAACTTAEPVTVLDPAPFCDSGDFTLMATSADSVSWFATSNTAGTVLDGGPTYTTGTITSTTSYWVAAWDDVNACYGAPNEVVAEIQTLQTITYSGDTAFCDNGTAFVPNFSPAGGTLTGTGTTSTEFDPSVAGVGTFTVYYDAGDACGSHDSIVFTVTGSTTDPTLYACEDSNVVVTGSLAGIAWFESAFTNALLDTGMVINYNLAQSTTLYYGDMPPAFYIDTITETNIVISDHNSFSGDDRGGIAISSNYFYYVGDGNTARIDLDFVGPWTSLPQRDGIFSDIETGQLYTLWDGTAGPVGTFLGGDYTISAIAPMDEDLNINSGSVITLSTPIVVNNNSGDFGIFAGEGMAVIWTSQDDQFYQVDLISGTVTNVGTGALNGYATENIAFWGVAEIYNGELAVSYRSNFGDYIERYVISSGATMTVANFTDVNDLACFTIDPNTNRFYFHHESSSTSFGGGSENGGYCDLTIVEGAGGSATCRTAVPVMVSKPVIDLGLDTTICSNTTLVLDPGAGFDTYEWSDASTSQTLGVNAVGDYYVTVTDSLGCPESDSISIDLNMVTDVDLGADVSICDYQIVVLNAGGGYSTYAWNNGETGQLLYVESDTLAVGANTYTVTTTDANGCITSDAMDIIVIDCASIEESGLELQVYPNPVKDILTVQLMNVDANASVELYNLQGSLVSAPIAVNNSTINVSMAAFADGVYILKVTSNGATQEVRVVKQ